MEITLKEVIEILNNGFIIVIGTALLKAIYILFRMNVQTKENSKDIENLEYFVGFRGRRKTDQNRETKIK